MNTTMMLTKQEALDLVSSDLRDRDGSEIIALVRPWSDLLNCYEWNKTTDTFRLNDEAFRQQLDGMPTYEAMSAAQKREWNEKLPDKYHEFVRVLIAGIIRRPNGEIDYNSACVCDANHWCTVHEQQIMDWADEVDQPGDMDWAWLERIYDFSPLFRSCREFDAYFSVVFHVHNEEDDNCQLTRDRDLLAAVGLNPDTDRQKCLDFLRTFAIRMDSFFDRPLIPPPNQSLPQHQEGEGNEHTSTE